MKDTTKTQSSAAVKLTECAICLKGTKCPELTVDDRPVCWRCAPQVRMKTGMREPKQRREGLRCFICYSYARVRAWSLLDATKSKVNCCKWCRHKIHKKELRRRTPQALVKLLRRKRSFPWRSRPTLRQWRTCGIIRKLENGV